MCLLKTNSKTKESQLDTKRQWFANIKLANRMSGGCQMQDAKSIPAAAHWTFRCLAKTPYAFPSATLHARITFHRNSILLICPLCVALVPDLPWRYNYSRQIGTALRTCPFHAHPLPPLRRPTPLVISPAKRSHFATLFSTLNRHVICQGVRI